MGAYDSDYVRLMAHVDTVQPGAVHRVIHEALLDDPAGEVRPMLAFLGQPFEAGCMAFNAHAPPVPTASTQQVLRPLQPDGVALCQALAACLGPPRAAHVPGRCGQAAA